MQTCSKRQRVGKEGRKGPNSDLVPWSLTTTDFTDGERAGEVNLVAGAASFEVMIAAEVKGGLSVVGWACIELASAFPAGDCPKCGVGTPFGKPFATLQEG
jgi:hypothetical protein